MTSLLLPVLLGSSVLTGLFRTYELLRGWESSGASTCGKKPDGSQGCELLCLNLNLIAL